ncbi:hypothetical protein C7S18_00765 [Ahniella affigens]|uniref:DUF4124 domain-containing protein n=1 Tax=Ahniella affigens TaxID=2021234 RepID=A0A2P1PLW0_9GAMM|nr:DUF4124 domain-containing protein [Ahniella affigens]AVP95819.1 hypothetical protein C7S18_00765 [Ahniella affigens]
MRVQAIAAFLLGTLLAASVAAQGNQEKPKKLYRWVDAQGNVHYSDTVPSDEIKNGRQEIVGSSVKTVARQKTPEELEAERQAALVEAELKRIRDAQDIADRALLMTYTSETDLFSARDKEIEGVDGTLATNKMAIASHEKALTDMLDSAAEFERAKKPVPKTMTDSINKIRKDLEEQRRLSTQYEASKLQIKSDYDKKLARYLELKARGKDERH